MVIARLVGAQNVGHLSVGHQRRRLRVVRRIQTMAASHALQTLQSCSPRTVNNAIRLAFPAQGSKLVRITQFPQAAPGWRNTRKPRAGFCSLLPRAKRATVHMAGNGLSRRWTSQIFWPLGPFRRNNDPFLGEKVLIAATSIFTPNKGPYRHKGTPG